MDKIKQIFKILLYLSFGFVIYYLYQFDYLQLQTINFNYYFATISVLLLWLGFFVSSLSWKNALKSHQIHISTSKAVYSHGISVFAKYIPGKIWVILGRASIISESGFSLLKTSTISLKEQLVYLLIGLLISLIALPFLPINIFITLIVALTAVGLYLFLFVKPIYNFSVGLLEKITKKKLDIPFINIKEAKSFSVTILLYWFIWSIAFYLLCKSIIPETSAWASFAFPLSVCYGLLAVVVPGGIGVRESIITLVLTATGLSAPEAITISVIQRLWFITGEIFIFTLAFVANLPNKQFHYLSKKA